MNTIALCAICAVVGACFGFTVCAILKIGSYSDNDRREWRDND